jgi:hypothetical protein
MHRMSITYYSMHKHFFLALSSGVVLADERDHTRRDLIGRAIDERKIGPGDQDYR